MNNNKINQPSRTKAIALKYDETFDAPVVVAKGKGITAQNILEKGKELNIPIQEDETLVELLGQLNINEAIPEDLYQAVAEIFAFVYQLDRQKGGK